MRKTKKLEQNKVGGNASGMVKRISIILVIVLLSFSFCGIFLYLNSSMSEIVVPQKVLGIPETALWHGGVDGGVWINIDTTDIVNQFNIQCYFEDGELWEKGIFILDSLSNMNVFSVQELHKRISAYDGSCILLTNEMYEENPKALLKKIE